MLISRACWLLCLFKCSLVECLYHKTFVISHDVWLIQKVFYCFHSTMPCRSWERVYWSWRNCWYGVRIKFVVPHLCQKRVFERLSPHLYIKDWLRFLLQVFQKLVMMKLCEFKQSDLEDWLSLIKLTLWKLSWYISCEVNGKRVLLIGPWLLDPLIAVELWSNVEQLLKRVHIESPSIGLFNRLLKFIEGESLSGSTLFDEVEGNIEELLKLKQCFVVLRHYKLFLIMKKMSILESQRLFSG